MFIFVDSATGDRNGEDKLNLGADFRLFIMINCGLYGKIQNRVGKIQLFAAKFNDAIVSSDFQLFDLLFYITFTYITFTYKQNYGT